MISCEICGGNNRDTPCAYPSGCLRDQERYDLLNRKRYAALHELRQIELIGLPKPVVQRIRRIIRSLER